MEKSKEGFSLIKNTKGDTYLLFDTDRSDECIRFAIENEVLTISINPLYYKVSNLIPLLPLRAHMKGLLLDTYIDYEELDKFQELSFLSIPDNGRDRFDLSSLQKLSVLAVEFSSRIKGLERCVNLKSLSITNFFSKKPSLEEFPGLPNLEELYLYKPKIASLLGLGKYSLLKKLEIFNATKLEAINELEEISKSLTELTLEGCKKIEDWETLRKMRQLKKLMLLDCGIIPTLNFLTELQKLEFFSFGGTNVQDGNLEICEKIAYVGFDNKRHYSHKWEDFKIYRKE